MRIEPTRKRAHTFFDGQNLFYAAKKAFGYSYPNYDPDALARAVCKSKGWELEATHFYTGVPRIRDDAHGNYFWNAKLAVMGTRGVRTFTRHLRYRNQSIILPDGKESTVLVGQEKGIDIRIALDVVRMARENRYDVAVLFSQDQDLSEVVDEIRSIAATQDRWLKLACAFPVGPTYENERGINRTDWIPIDRATYQCVPRPERLQDETARR